MAPITTGIVVALATAVVVLVVAGTTRGVRRSGFRQFFGDLWAGIRRAPAAGGTGLLADTREELRGSSEAGGVADLFAVGETPEKAYVEPDEITAPLARATRRTLRGVFRRARS
jgi:hypothetical protein